MRCDRVHKTEITRARHWMRLFQKLVYDKALDRGRTPVLQVTLSSF